MAGSLASHSPKFSSQNKARSALFQQAHLLFERSKTLTQESSLIVTGKIREHFRKPGQYEMDVTHLEIVQLAQQNYPISHKEHGPCVART